MKVQDLNIIAGDLAVLRIEIRQDEAELEAIMMKDKRIQELQQRIEKNKQERLEKQNKLLEAMREEELKSWKTEQATFSRISRKSVSIDPTFKKQVENRLKEGENVEGFSLTISEYISIRSSK